MSEKRRRRRSVSLRPEVWDKLKEFADGRGRSMSSVLEAIILALHEDEKQVN